MWLTIITGVLRLIGLADWFHNWLANREKEREINDEISAYKREANLYSAPARDESAVINALRKDRDG